MDLQKRLISKQWQDRIKAYEDLGDLLVRDVGGDAVARYAPFLKRMVADTANPRAQEAALSTLVSFLQHLATLRDPSRYVLLERLYLFFFNFFHHSGTTRPQSVSCRAEEPGGRDLARAGGQMPRRAIDDQGEGHPSAPPLHTDRSCRARPGVLPHSTSSPGRVCGIHSPKQCGIMHRTNCSRAAKTRWPRWQPAAFSA